MVKGGMTGSMTVFDLMQFCTANGIDMAKANVVIATKQTEDDFVAASHCVWNGMQLIVYKEELDG